MYYSHDTSSSVSHTHLPYSGLQAVSVQILLLASTVILPITAHLLNAPVRLLLPMHWPVILAAMIYGWKAGAVTGALAPLLSYLVSGYPMPNILPSMTAELFVYGCVAGVLSQKYKVNSFIAIAASIGAGRLVFVAFVLLTNRASISDTEYFSAALLPGIVAAIGQIISIPFISHYIITKFQKDDTL